MSAYGTLSPTARPPRVLPTPWALPTPAFATWQGCRGKPPAPLPESVGSPQPVKAKPQAVASQALTGFSSIRFGSFCYSHGGGEGSRAAKPCIFTLDALEPTQHFATGSGGWVLTACPCGAASEAGVWGKAPVSVDTRKASMYCKCMRLQKIQGSDMKLGGYLSILTNLTTSR